MIHIRKSKNDAAHKRKGLPAGRKIGIPYNTMQHLLELYRCITTNGHLPGLPDLKVPHEFNPINHPDAPIFWGCDIKNRKRTSSLWKQWSPEALSHAFIEARDNANIDPVDEHGDSLTFHSLRTNAYNMLRGASEPTLSETDIDYYTNGTMPSKYSGRELPKERMQRILDSLDRHFIKVNVFDNEGNKIIRRRKPVLTGATLDEVLEDFGYTMEDMIQGMAAIPVMTRWSIAKGKVFIDSMGTHRKVTVHKIKINGNDTILLPGRVYTEVEAAKITGCDLMELMKMSLGEKYDGTLVHGDYQLERIEDD